MKRLENILLLATLFLIPSNLAFHWYHSGAYLSGRLVDYLLPKFYFSDLTLLGAILIYVFYYNNLTLFTNIFNNLYLVLLFIYLLVLSLFSPIPVSSLWLTLKYFQLIIFGYYLFRKLPYLSSKLVPVLTLSLVFQSIIGIYQFINQKSIIGYLLLGEPGLERLGIAKESFFGHLKIPPYGTTSHPNVLAGFIVVTLTILWLKTSNFFKNTNQFITNSLFIGLSILVLFLTLSLESFLAFFLISGLMFLYHHVSTHKYTVLILAIIVSTLAFSPLFIDYAYHSPLISATASITERYELNRAAFKAIAESPLFGIGPNLFTYYLSSSGLAPGQRSFVIQPVHHLGLLLLAETGFVGFILALLSIKKAIWGHLKRLNPKQLIPLAAVMVISGFDHYFLTLQTGQMLLVLAIVYGLNDYSSDFQLT